MENLLVVIGEHAIHLQFNSARAKRMFHNTFSSIRITRDRPAELIIQLEDGYGVPYVDDNVSVTRDRRKIHYFRSDYSLEVDLDFRCAAIRVHNELALKHALLHLYSSFVVHRNWGLVLHSSCVLEAGKAHLFAGPSGAGKSTAASLSLPRDILADEAAIVKIGPDSVNVYRSPFRSDFHSEHTDDCGEPCEPGSIQILHQALENQRMKLSKSDGLLQLMGKVFYWSALPEEAQKIVSLLAILADRVPVYKLSFQKNPSFWELIS